MYLRYRKIFKKVSLKKWSSQRLLKSLKLRSPYKRSQLKTKNRLSQWSKQGYTLITRRRYYPRQRLRTLSSCKLYCALPSTSLLILLLSQKRRKPRASLTRSLSWTLMSKLSSMTKWKTTKRERSLQAQLLLFHRLQLQEWPLDPVTRNAN